MGHAEGDQLLECVGAMLAECTRSTDVVDRRGGDEFAVLLPGTDAAGARIFFDRLRQRLLDHMRERGGPVGLCIGVALFAAAPPREGDALRYADSLMYQGETDRRESCGLRRVFRG